MLNINNRIEVKDVEEFNLKNCNENTIISKIVKDKFQNYFTEPILDVGAGLGDVSLKALYNKKVYLIDANDYSRYPLSSHHVRQQIDFFDFVPPGSETINTVFIAHTLQCIDDDVDKLNEKIKSLNPQYVIIVQNQNNDFVGEIVKWAEQYVPNANPEVKLKDFPKGYKPFSEVEFTGNLQCSDFEKLSDQILKVLLFVDIDDKMKKKFIKFLKDGLPKPALSINETITVYGKEK